MPPIFRAMALMGLAMPALANPAPATAQRAADVVTIGVAAPATSVDPHFFNAAPNSQLASHVFSRLIERDARVQLQPGLAESWRAIAPTVWEFRLRPGVTWHDGRPFTAEDVAFSLARAPHVPNSPGGYGSFLRLVKQVEVVGPLTIRLHTRQPHALLPTEIAYISIIARHAAQGATTEDFNSGRAAIGTGPYRLLSHSPNDRTELARNDTFFGPREPWSRVTLRFIGHDAARTAALLAGEVDMIDQVPTADLARLRAEPRVGLFEIQGLRLIFLQVDFSHDGAMPFVTDQAGQPLPRNPFLDLRIRRALSLAIDREALAEQVMEGAARPAGQWLPPGVYSHDPDTPVPPFAPEQARRLLAEAGYPDGFRLTLHSPNDRYPNDARTAQAVARMWSRIGIRTEVAALPWASFSARSARQEFAVRLSGWGSSTGEASYFLANVLGTYDPAARRGAANAGRYSNPALDLMVDRAAAILDPEERERLLRGAVHLASEEVALIPLFHLVNAWATRAGLRYDARMDERSLATGLRRAQ
ncbi:ABC transporter substrate-binding protein [Belnapia rosea]|uniref:ABC transporter substrate-binding protein n=1 Tax=Belnapia rosea TaxID=938405 RepID=UPI00088190FE|nr:peptide/nickel transport system substrate-binding protein [Belnapia rosea]